MDLTTIASASVAAGLLTTSATRLALTAWRGLGASLRNRWANWDVHAELSRATEHARLASELRRQSVASPSGGWRVMEVVETKQETEDCLSIYLQDPLQRSQLASFQPGQFLLVRPALGGATMPARCYSLSDCPGQPWWRITVKRQSLHDTSLSCWIHQHLRAGDSLLVSGPHGQFTLDPASNHPVVLLAAGIGITPLLSMLKSALAAHPQRSIALLYQVSDVNHWPFGEVVHRWCQQFEALSVTTYFSRQSDVSRVEGGQVKIGKFTAVEVLPLLNESTHVYMCGPEPWMQTLTAQLQQSGMPADQIHFESFAAGEDNADPEQVDPWSIHFARSQRQTETSAARSNVWQAANSLGINLPAGCHTGACGSCKLKKLRGQVSYRKPPTCQHTEDEIVACLAQPVGELEVDA